jgi:hypothetical protein
LTDRSVCIKQEARIALGSGFHRSFETRLHRQRLMVIQRELPSLIRFQRDMKEKPPKSGVFVRNGCQQPSLSRGNERLGEVVFINQGPKLLKGSVLDLANPFFGNIEFLADLAERMA